MGRINQAARTVAGRTEGQARELVTAPSCSTGDCQDQGHLAGLGPQIPLLSLGFDSLV